jgi:DNA-directed RNA polymerase sigma subunit (sigma70/sigma32)
LDQLPDRERLILEMHYGLRPVPGIESVEVPFEEIRNHLPVRITRERVRQLETQALNRLRETVRRNKFKMEDVL